ncbi:MAG TPA: hypothetical protein DIW81_22625 [Planctomycetaceae bacterium]|uniref:cation-transporting P-type ATPase n=1 Tax=Rubinisphaera sp. TaxID=2024857 RepID=UPI000C0E9C16|nr:hypothetical protein [Rubinisphaera sp.]HCS54341.1 hypothetical protein [Planctomycetaceae bacterium]
MEKHNESDNQSNRDEGKEHGANQLREVESRSSLIILLQQFKSMVIHILAIAAVLAFSTSRLG